MVECLYCESSETWEDETNGLDGEFEKNIDKALNLFGIDGAVDRGSETKYGCQECGARFIIGNATILFNRVTKEGDKDKRII